MEWDEDAYLTRWENHDYDARRAEALADEKHDREMENQDETD